jgi:predicted HTH domain antitoxin
VLPSPAQQVAMSRSIHIEYPSSLPDALQKTPAEFEREARLAMATKLFEMKRLSSGQAAMLADIDRTTFLMQLSEHGVAMVDVPVEELADDVRHAKLSGIWLGNALENECLRLAGE